jgi:hypothetical protein
MDEFAMNNKERTDFEQKLDNYMKEKKVDEVFQLMSERLLFDLPSDPKAYLLNLLKHRWDYRVTFVVSGPQIELSQGMLDEVKSRYPAFDYLLCSQDSNVKDVKGFLDGCRGGVSHRCVFNYPQKLDDIDGILRAGIHFDKMIFCTDSKPVGVQKILWDQYKGIAVKIGSSEIYDYLKVMSIEQTQSSTGPVHHSPSHRARPLELAN